jgi:hypothetical protein
MTVLVSRWPLAVAMSGSSLAYAVGALLIAWAMFQLSSRPVYRCPSCGSKRADGHAQECPWRSRP